MQQLTTRWPQFKALRHSYAGTRFEEQRQLQIPQKHKASVLDSTLRVEMDALGSKLTTPSRDIHWKPLWRDPQAHDRQ